MSKKMKISYLINLIGVILLYLAMTFVFDNGVLGAKTTYITGIAIIAMMTIIIVCSPHFCISSLRFWWAVCFLL